MHFRIREWIDVRPGERFITVLMLLYIFGALTAYYILKPLRSGLFLSELPSSSLVYAYWLSALFAGTVATPMFALSRRMSAIHILTATNALIISTLTYFYWAIGRAFPFLPYVYYVYIQVVPVIIIAQFWLLAGYIFDNRQAKRIYGLLGAGASGGALAGSVLVRVLRRSLGFHTLMLVCIGITSALIVLSLAAWRHRRMEDGEPRRRFEADNGSIRDLFGMVFSSRHLLLMSGFILLTMISSQIADWQINDAVQRAFGTIARKQRQIRIDEFFAAFNLYTNLLGIVLQVFATSLVVRRLGIWAATLFLPSAVFLSSIPVVLGPTLIATVLVEGSDSIFRYSLNRAGLELLYMPFSPDVRKKVKMFIDVCVDRFGRAIAGAIVFAVTNHFLPFGLRGSSAVIIVLSGVSIFICLELRKTYVIAFRDQLTRKAVDQDNVDPADPASVGLLTQVLKSGQERQIIYALGLLRSVKRAGLSEHILPLLGHDSEFVREEAVRALSSLERDCSQQVEPLLDDASARVRRAAVDFLCSRPPSASLARIRALLEHPRAEIRLATAAWIAENENQQNWPATDMVRRLLRMDGAESVQARATAAAFARRLPPQEAESLIGQLLQHPSPEVRRAAVRASAPAGLRQFLPEFIHMLKDREMRAAAVEALAGYGEPIVGVLERFLASSEDIALRREIPRILGRIPSAQSAKILVRHLREKDPLVRYGVVKALNRLHDRTPHVWSEDPEIARQIYHETRNCYEALVLLHALEPDSQKSGDSLIVKALREKLDQNLEIIFRLLGLQYSQTDIYHAYTALRGTSTDRQASAVEFLDNLLDRDLKTIILPLLEESSARGLTVRAAHLFGIEEIDRHKALRIILDQPDLWLKACAIHEIGKQCIPELLEECRGLKNHDESLIRETAEWALRQCAYSS